MRIAIPLADGRVSAHFGHCEHFALIDTDPDNQTVTYQSRVPAPAHEPGLLPEWLQQQGVDLVIAGGMGPRAQELLAHRGIRVLVGAPSDDPLAVVQAYLAGTLATGANLCDH